MIRLKYSFDSKVGYSELSSKGYMSVGAVLDRFQDCSNFHSDSLGVGMEYLSGKKRGWILNSWQIVFDNKLKMGDNIKVYTWAYSFDKMFGYRNFMIEDEYGNKCVRAASRWILMDTDKMRPVKIESSDVEMYGTEEKLDMDYSDRKIAVPEELEEEDRIKVRGYHIDTNGHMNNAWYVKIAMDYLESDNIKSMRVEYKKSAVLNDIMKVKTASADNGKMVVLCDAQDKVYSVIEFTLGNT